jgi:hypothetical protein
VTKTFGHWLFSWINWQLKNFSHHPMTLCGCYMRSPLDGNWIFLVAKIFRSLYFFYIKGIGIFKFSSFSSQCLQLRFYFTSSVIHFEQSGHSMHYFVLLWFQIWLQIQFILLHVIPRQVMSINQVAGKVTSRKIQTLILKTFTLGTITLSLLGTMKGKISYISQA